MTRTGTEADWRGTFEPNVFGLALSCREAVRRMSTKRGGKGGVIVNADALQVYGNWRVLTARPSVAEEAALPHALYGHVGREAAYSVGHWLRELRALLSEQRRTNRLLQGLIYGGLGFALGLLAMQWLVRVRLW